MSTMSIQENEAGESSKLVLKQLSEAIEHLAKLHILYHMEHTPLFEKQKVHISELIKANHINARSDLDPITKNLYNRYFS